MTPAEIVAEARNWIGVPFVHQGRGRKGVDCIGLAICVGRACDLVPALFDYRAYGPEPMAGELERVVATHCKRHEGPLVPGLLVLCRWFREAQHAALTAHREDLGYDTLIHAGGGFARVVEHRLDAKWTGRIRSAWQLPGVAY